MDDVTPERWLPIVRWEDSYEVSNLGRVRNKRTARLIGYATSIGYRGVTLCDGSGANEQRYIHELVAEAFIGPRPPGQEVRHLDGSRDNNIVSNLAYGTRSRNAYDSLEHGTHFNGGKDFCPQRHEYTPENTYLHPGGGRVCRICSSEAKRRYKQRKKAAA